MIREILIAIIFVVGTPVLVGSIVRFIAFATRTHPKANRTLLASLFASFVLMVLSMGVTLASPYQAIGVGTQVIVGVLLFLIAIGFWMKSLQFNNKRWLLIEGGVLFLLIAVTGVITFIEGEGENYFYDEPLSDTLLKD